jgi:bifunctional non-homologous end joining protein LigD
MGPVHAQLLRVGTRAVPVTNLNKILFPQSSTSKAAVIDYYVRVSPLLLPHLVGRPVTLKRYPNGVAGSHFYQKQAPASRPPWIKTLPVALGGRTIDFVLIEDLASLVWVANLANLELHPVLARAPHLERPTVVAFDLDPGPGADVRDCARVALRLQASLADLGLRAYGKTSGGKGFQVYVPLNSACTFAETKAFAHAMSLRLEKETPDLVTSRMSKQERTRRVFIDWSQNSNHKTTVAVYSLRANDPPTVSTPMTWKEVRRALDEGTLEGFRFLPEDVLQRAAVHGDPFAHVLTRKQSLNASLPEATSGPKRHSTLRR